MSQIAGKPGLQIPARMRSKLEKYQRRIWMIKLAEGLCAAAFGLLLSYLVVFGLDRVYDDTTGGVPPLVDWIHAMLDGTPDWTNVQCTDCGTTFPGDPMPDTLPTDPFDVDGNSVCP